MGMKTIFANCASFANYDSIILIICYSRVFMSTQYKADQI